MASYISSWFTGSASQKSPTAAPTPDGRPSPSRSNSASSVSVKSNGVAKPARAPPTITLVNGDEADEQEATPRASLDAAGKPSGVPGVLVADADGDAELTMFPAPNSAQRVSAPAPTPTITLASPPPSPTVLDGSDRHMPPPPVPASSGIGGLKAAVKAQKKQIKRQLKERLAPGHSQMDWAILKAKGNLRGVDQLTRVTPSMLAAHNTKDDAWSVFFGKVYNITPYMTYHPGGEKKLIRVAGKDGTRLFVHSHEWVNIEAMMDECFVGFLVPEPASDD